ncbi:MAG: plastocyanin/azurin family copper-binding protein [Solirubrobacteraceae bacterium]
MNKILPILATAAAALALSVPAFGATKGVKVVDDKFSAATITIHKGDTVKWTWAGKNPHNVKFSGFTSKVQVKGTFSHRFKKKGTFKYLCVIHSGMTGKVIVK